MTHSKKVLSPKVKEADVQRTILDYLSARHIFHYRQNTGAVKTPEGRFFRFGASGSPDIVAVIKGRYVGIEVKGSGGKQSEEQKAFEKELENAGGKYILAYSLEGLVASLGDEGKITN